VVVLRFVCRVKGGQELVAAIQAAKQARLKVRTNQTGHSSQHSVTVLRS
jgi:hypothetical protein